MTSPASALAIVSGLLLAGPAAAQVASVDSRNSPSSLRCSALGQIDEAERPAAIHFMTGYSSGERDATAFATVGPADVLGGDAPQGGTEQAGGAIEPQSEQSTEETGGIAGPVEVPETGPTGGPPAAVLPTVPVEAILAACAQSPDSRIIDIIIAQGALGTD